MYTALLPGSYPASWTINRISPISPTFKNHVPGSHGVFFLPYLTGERFPIMDSHIRASFLGLSQDTSATDMAGSVLEGVAFPSATAWNFLTARL